jgi:hypothetical protein
MAIQPITIQLGGFFQSNESFLGSAGNLSLSYDVPAQKRLTIESVSAFASLPKGQSAALSLLVLKKVKPGGMLARYQLPLDYQVRYNPNPTNPSQVVLELWSMNHSLRAYIDGGLQLKLDAFRGLSNSAGGGAEAVITGFLEDIV